jgi:iron complex outermembrane receptor protein
MNLPWKLELDAALSRAGRVVHANGFTQQAVIPAHTRADVRLGWRPSPRWELSVSGQNLLDPRHPEFHAFDTYVAPGAQVRRSVYGRLAWRF